MANNVFAINTKADPAYVSVAGPGSSGLVFAIIVADTTFLTVALAGAVPTACFAIVQSTNQIFYTPDNINWDALS